MYYNLALYNNIIVFTIKINNISLVHDTSPQYLSTKRSLFLEEICSQYINEKLKIVVQYKL